MKKRVMVFEAMSSLQWPFDRPTALAEITGWFAEMLESVPQEHRDTAICEFDTESDYDCHYPTIKIFYDREETPEEAREREDAADARARADIAHARATIARLKAKYGDA
jgi:hypothetical protein